jgi:hypothetical protein
MTAINYTAAFPWVDTADAFGKECDGVVPLDFLSCVPDQPAVNQRWIYRQDDVEYSNSTDGRVNLSRFRDGLAVEHNGE